MAKRAGAESVQGYLLGKPMSSANFVDLVAQNCSGDGEEQPRAVAN
jgi:EAL domain-containing protein (putative c-di-GMP-specific phosphodiesterase class I)